MLRRFHTHRKCNRHFHCEQKSITIPKPNENVDPRTRFGLYVLAKNAVTDTYYRKQKVDDLVNIFIKKTSYTNNAYLDITKLLDQYNINSAQLLKYIYICLTNWNCNKVGSIDRNLFNYCHFDGKIDRFMIESTINQPFNIEYFDGEYFGIKFRKRQSDCQYIDTERFELVNGKNVFYQILLQLVQENMRQNYHGHNSICHNKTVDIMYHMARIFVDKRAPGWIPIDSDDIFVEELIRNSTFSENDTMIEIRSLMNKYRIQPYELFYEMYHNATNDNQSFISLTEAKYITELTNGYVTNCHGVKLGCHFELDKAKPQYIKILHENDKLFEIFIMAIFKLIYGRMLENYDSL